MQIVRNQTYNQIRCELIMLCLIKFVTLSQNLTAYIQIYNYQMAEVQPFSPLIEIQNTPTIKDRFRNLQFKLKKPKNELQDYELKENIGQGGFGRVKKAIHKPTGETVAVKILKIDPCQPEQVQSVKGQILLQQKLLHQNIAQIYEVIKKDNKIYIFMEYCPNGELLDHIVNNGPMGEREAARVLAQILSALIYLKKMGISHRDIKPENILFDKFWNIKLVDFGFSCTTLSADGDFRGTICGTPSYTPPQILLKHSYNPQLMDVWSLGVTLYAMLAGQLPFQGDTNQKRRAKIIGCKWSAKPFFSSKVKKIFNSIFVEANERITLQALFSSQFVNMSQIQIGNFIDYKNDILVPEQSIVALAQKQYKVDKRKMMQSVKSYKLDRLRAIYYLLLKKQIQNDDNGASNISTYKKQRKNSIMKLQPIIRTPRKEDKLTKAELPNLQIVSRGKTIQVNNCRLRREATPESPRRLIDCLAIYKGF